MKTLALVLLRFTQTFRIEPGSPDAMLRDETADALVTFFGDAPIPADEIHLVEEAVFSRFLAARLEEHIGERGVFVRKGDDPQGRINPAVNAAIRARSRYAKIMNELAKRRQKSMLNEAGAVVVPTPPTQTESTIEATRDAHSRDAAHAKAQLDGYGLSPAQFMNKSIRRRAAKLAKKAAAA